jgi:hypothetical protein
VSWPKSRIIIKIKPVIWDHYKTDVRNVLTLLLLGFAALAFLAGSWILSGASILAAAIAFHAENKLILDPANHKYERRRLVRPLGMPQTGTLDDFECIQLSSWAVKYGIEYQAALILPGGKYDCATRFVVASGPLRDVLKVADRLSKDTGIPIEESDDFRIARETFGVASDLINRSP